MKKSTGRCRGPTYIEETHAHEGLLVPGSTLVQSFSHGSPAFQTFAIDDPENIVGTSLQNLRFDASSIMVSTF